MTSQRVRVRFAPSPTGDIHIGGLRTALYNYLFAKHNKGDFILRVEDTDQTRKVPGAIEQLVRVMKEFDITPDEGPQLSEKNIIEEYGSFGPYTQSKRTERYKEIAEKLISLGHAYYCFCTSDRLEQLRQIQQKKNLPPKYDGHCRNLDASEIKKKLAANTPRVVRLKVPRSGTLTFSDIVRGKVDFSYSLVDEQVLIKSDGYPTYHLANVVDDHDMEISHVIRGEEWLPSVPKHIYLYKALGWVPPQMAHLSILLDQKKAKLSKRTGAASVDQFLSLGLLPEAILNYLLLLGWNSKTEQEIFSRDEMISLFSLESVNVAGAMVDMKKLSWMNKAYLHNVSSSDILQYAVRHHFLPESWLKKTKQSSAWLEFFSLVKDRISYLTELQDNLEYFFTHPKVDAVMLKKKSKKVSTIEILGSLKDLLLEIENWKYETLKEVIEKDISEKGISRGEVLWPLRVALSGREFSPGAYELLGIFNKQLVVERLERAEKVLQDTP